MVVPGGFITFRAHLPLPQFNQASSPRPHPSIGHDGFNEVQFWRKLSRDKLNALFEDTRTLKFKSPLTFPYVVRCRQSC